MTLTAAADPESTFVGWSSACTGLGDCEATMNTNTGVVASFEAEPELLCDTPLDGTTEGETNLFVQYSCAPNLNGRDAVYKLTPPEAGQVTVTVTPETINPVLVVLNSFNGQDCNVIENSSDAGIAEQVQFDANANQTYHVVVEDIGNLGGSFELVANCPCSAPDGPNIHLANATVNDAQSYDVCMRATFGPGFTIGPTGSVHVNVGHSAVINNGFTVQENGQLRIGN